MNELLKIKQKSWLAFLHYQQHSPKGKNGNPRAGQDFAHFVIFL
jgi:hypothetical protein